MISDADLGWIAAIIDMKGSVNIKNNKTRVNSTPQVVLRVNTTDKRIAERLSALTGTAPEPRETREVLTGTDFLRRGCKEHCPESHIHVDEGGHVFPASTRWTITGTAMGVVLWNVRKFMSTYPEYSQYMGLVFGNTVTSGQGSGQVRASVRRLKDLGWRIPSRIDRELTLSETAPDGR